MLLKSFFSFFSAFIHVLGGGWLPCCRFSPSCSQYAAEAVHRHGWFRGLSFIISRLWRCRPGGKSWGWDPVPFKVLEQT